MQCHKCKNNVSWTYDIIIYPLDLMSLCPKCREKFVKLIQKWVINKE